MLVFLKMFGKNKNEIIKSFFKKVFVFRIHVLS